jgi:hypothetical protein
MKMKIKISILLFACALLFAIFILPILGYKNVVYKLDTYSPFWIFSLQLGLVFLLFTKLSKDFYRWLKNLISLKNAIPISLIIACAIAISIAFIEPRSRIQSDEAIHYVIAQNLYYNQIGQFCGEGSFMEDGFACVLSDTIKTRGLSYIYMLGMPIFGKHLYWVHTLHLFFLALALLSFYLALLAWLGRAGLALLATALLSSCPVLLFNFRSASVEPLYVTLFCVSLLLSKWVYDRNTTRHWLLLALTLAFFAQTRTETIFCLGAFIWVAFYRMCLNHDLLDSRINRIAKFKSILFSILNSQFSIFLATLSFFSLPVLCTISLNRGHDLQGGSLGAYGHLFSNIVSNFKVMALQHFSDDGTLKYPFLPYFTWLAIFGLIILLLCLLKFKFAKFSILHSPFSIKHSSIALFLLLLSPQYIILFNGVSADLRMTVQWRFALVILPMMAFLGALFLWKAGVIFCSYFHSHKLLPKITLYGAVIIILATCLAQYKTFIKDTPNMYNFATTEDYELHKWIRQEPPKRMLFFYWFSSIGLAHGHSTYLYSTLLQLNSEDLKEILDDYNGEVYFINTSICDEMIGEAKMQVPNSFRACDRAVRYFNTKEVFRKRLIAHFKDFSIHKILGFNDIDSLGLLRITNKIEPTDSTVELQFYIPKELSKPWKVQKLVNDSLVFESKYKRGFHKDIYNLSLFDKDTNYWRLHIMDTISGERVHSDFWELVRVKHKK